MPRYFLEIAYLGTAYEGWQGQKRQGAVTIQGTIEQALSAVLAREVPIIGAGRTDAGVHARQSFAHFDHHHALPKGLLKALNRLLPDDISVARIIQVADGAHTRYDATARSYAYYLHFAKDPFLVGRSWLYPYGLPDLGILKQAAGLLVREADFSAFSRRNPDLKHNRCTIYNAGWETTGGGLQLLFRVSANRYLHNMVRRLVGAQLMVARGKLNLHDIESALESQQPLRININVAPEGLYLTQVTYPYIDPA